MSETNICCLWLYSYWRSLSIFLWRGRHRLCICIPSALIPPQQVPQQHLCLLHPQLALHSHCHKRTRRVRPANQSLLWCWSHTWEDQISSGHCRAFHGWTLLYRPPLCIVNIDIVVQNPSTVVLTESTHLNTNVLVLHLHLKNLDRSVLKGTCIASSSCTLLTEQRSIRSVSKRLLQSDPCQ